MKAILCDIDGVVLRDDHVLPGAPELVAYMLESGAPLPERFGVLKMIVLQGMRTVGIGVAIGIVGSLLLTRTIESLLFGVSATDPLTFGAVPLLLGATALLACYLPARRASNVNPMVALRYE